MGLRENWDLNVYELIDFLSSQKSSIELSLHFEQPSTAFLQTSYKKRVSISTNKRNTN